MFHFFFSLSIIFIPFVLIPFIVTAQSVESTAATAPTSFSSTIHFEGLEDAGKALSTSPGVHLQDSGGFGKFETLSIRGSRAKDISVSLEDVRLNSLSGGEFDFGLLSTEGLEDAKIIRGGYSPYSTDPNGQVLLRLPRTPKYKTTLGGGSFKNIAIAQELPFASFSYEQGENDFRYESGGVYRSRNHNASEKINARAWLRTENTLTWTQLLYNDLELPGSTTFPSPNASSETLMPTFAFQGFRNNYELLTSGTYQRQIFNDTDMPLKSTNHWWASNIRLKHRLPLTSSVFFENGLENAQDKLTSTQNSVARETFHSPWRLTTNVTSSAFVTFSESQLIHPRIRFEHVSDLHQDGFSFHPGIGGKHPIPNTTLMGLWNFAYISRAPNFNEMYFDLPGVARANRDLKRQKSLQGDIGYEAHASFWRARIVQAFFWNRTSDLLESTLDSTGISQTQNQGVGIAYGLENEASVQPYRALKFSGNYTLQKTSLGSRRQFYQPVHRLNLAPTLFPDEFVSVSMPVYARSNVLTSAAGEKSASQIDLGVNLTAHLHRYLFRLQLMNLLAWRREELKNYPLPEEPWVKLFLSAEF